MTVGGSTDELNDSLLIWHNWPAPESQLIEEIIDRFQETHPNVEITTEYVPNHQFDERFVDRANSGLDPDLIIGIEPSLLYTLSEQNLLRDLSQADLKTEDLLPKSTESLMLNGVQVAIPFSAYTNVLFYNKAEVDRPAETLDQLMAAAGSGARVAIPTDFYHAYWGVHAFGGEIISPDGSLVEDNAFASWLHFLESSQSEPTILLNHIYEDLYQAFASGNAVYFVGNSIDLPYLEEALGEGNVGVMPLPGMRIGDAAGSFLELETIAISANASPPQAEIGIELINFFVNPTQQRRIALSNFGQIPLHQEVSFDERLAPITAVLIQQAKRSNFFPLEFTEKIDLLRITGTEIYIQVLEGVISPQDALSNLVTTVNQNQNAPDIDLLLTPQINSIERQSEAEQVANTELFFDIFRKANIYLNRPIVQIQLVSIVIGLSLAWILAEALRFLMPKLGSFLRSFPFIASWLERASNYEAHPFGAFWKVTFQISTFLYQLAKAVTFPILGFAFLFIIRGYLLGRGDLAGILLKMEWVIGAILLYSFISVFLRQIIDDSTARSAEIRYLRPAFLVGLGLAILLNLADLFVVAEIILTNLFDSPVTVI